MTDSTLSSALIGVVVAGWLLFGIAVAIRPRASSGPDRRRDLTSHLAVVVQSIGFALAWGWRGNLGAGPLRGLIGPWGSLLLTVVLAWGSGVFAVMAVRTLGAQWSIRARITDTHRLITSGPYAVVRHPIYTSLLGLLLATGIALSSPTAVLVGSLFYVIGTLWRVRLEERLLRQTFGEEHAKYVARVPAFIPGWPQTEKQRAKR